MSERHFFYGRDLNLIFDMCWMMITLLKCKLMYTPGNIQCVLVMFFIHEKTLGDYMRKSHMEKIYTL